MTTKKAYFGLIAVLVAIIASIGGMMYFSRVFLKSNADKLVAAKLELYKVDETESAYRKNQGLLQNNKDTAEILAAIAPAEKDQARAVREITQMAAESGLSVKAVRFPGSDLVITKKSTTADQKTATTQSISQAKPVPGLNNVLGIAVEVELNNSNPNAAISTDQVLTFLQKLENNRRNMRVTSINFGSAVDEGKTLKVDTLLFIKP